MKKLKSQKTIQTVFFAFLFAPAAAFGFSGPLQLSGAGAGGASLKEDFSYLINPALIGLQKKSKAAAAYSFKKKDQNALFTFLDIKTKFPLAITYQRLWTNSFTKSKKNIMLVSSGFQVLPSLAIGAAVERELIKSTWNGSIGMALRLGYHTSLALFLTDVLKKEGKDQRVLSLAAYTDWKSVFSSRLNLSRTIKKEWIFRASLEKSFFRSLVSLKLGGFWNSKEKIPFFSGGLAFNSPRVSLEYGIQKEQKDYRQALALNIKI